MTISFVPSPQHPRPDTGHPVGPADVRDRRLRDRPREIALVRDSDFAETRRRRAVDGFAHRALNVGLALIAVIVLSPVLLLVAIGVKLTSPGPILYRQTRVGLDRRRARRSPGAYDRRMRDIGGQVFRLYKFRSMRVDAEKGTGAVWATKDDPRVTSFGKFIRKCRLDELPQLFNVIRGDMNLVGPRPERPSIFAKLREGIPEYPERQKAKPGITGWAQINQSYDACLDDVKRKVRYDIEYIRRRSLIGDLRILAQTVPVVLLRRGGW